MNGVGFLSVFAAIANALGLAIGAGFYWRTTAARPAKAVQAANINLLVGVTLAAANAIQSMPIACADELFPRIGDSIACVMYAALLNLGARVWLRMTTKE